MRNTNRKLDRIVRKPELLSTIGVSDATLWRWEREGLFPKRVKLGPQSCGWFASEVQDWLKGREDSSITPVKDRQKNK